MSKKLAPAERVKRLRLRYGSHDKLASALGTKRQTIIRWEKGAGISADYAQRLAELEGTHPESFRPRAAPAQFREIYGEVLRQAEELKEVRAEVAAIREAVEGAGLAVPESR